MQVDLLPNGVKHERIQRWMKMVAQKASVVGLRDVCVVSAKTGLRGLITSDNSQCDVWQGMGFLTC